MEVRLLGRRHRPGGACRAAVAVCLGLVWACLSPEVAGAAPAKDPAPVTAPGSDAGMGRGADAPALNRAWDALVNGFVEEYFSLHPVFAVGSGRHEFDGRLPDWSPAGIESVLRSLHAARARVAGFDATALDERRRLDRETLLVQIDSELFWIETARMPYRSPSWYEDALDPEPYLGHDYAPLPERLRAYIAYARAIPLATRQIRSNLQAPLARPYIRIGHILFQGLAEFYATEVPELFRPVADEGLQRSLAEANAAAIDAVRELDDWLSAQEAGANDDFALGAARMRQMLVATEHIDLPLADLQRIGERDLERNLRSLRAACVLWVPGLDLEACLARANADKEPGSVVDAATRQLAGLEAFVRQQDIATVPPGESARVRAAPAYKRSNGAYIDIPGPYEKGLPSTYYIAPPDPAWSQQEREQYIPGRGSLLYTSVHEVWPGHFLQFLHSQRVPSPVARLFGTYAYVEGWAHYCEEMMYEAGLGAGDPELHVGQIEEALLRDVRFLSAIGLHTGTMTVEQSEVMFRTQAFQDPGNARQQALRGAYDPEYLKYTLGKLIIRHMREQWTATRGGRSAWRDFHDRFLDYGAAPLPALRERMLGAGAGPLLPPNTP